MKMIGMSVRKIKKSSTTSNAVENLDQSNGVEARARSWVRWAGQLQDSLNGSRRFKPLASWVATWALLLSPCAPVHAGLLRVDVNFSNYDAPLYRQIVNRIKDKVAARLGVGVNIQDRYFIVSFAYQDKWNDPESAHSFISVIRVLADGKQPSFTSGIRLGRVKNRKFEAFTISWMPHAYRNV
jgi:hypothetical protein